MTANEAITGLIRDDSRVAVIKNEDQQAEFQSGDHFTVKMHTTDVCARVWRHQEDI